MIEPPNIPIEILRSCLRDRYDLVADTLEFLPRGYDYHAGVFRVVGMAGNAYLLKVTSRPLYAPGCFVPRYLHDRGISAVVAPFPTASGSLWTTIGEWTAMVYPFLEGDTSLTGMTDDQWKESGRICRRIHQAPLPSGGFPSIRAESFDPTEYLRRVQACEAEYLPALDAQPGGRSGAARALRASWAEHQPAIHTAMTSLEHLGAALRSRKLPHVIAHADLHAANLLRDRAGRVFVLDWDEVMLAPKERDFIFIREFIRGPQASAFWKGYGLRAREEHAEIDWVALAYFRWERVIQDLIEEAQQALLTDEASEEAKGIAARRFAASFLPGGNVAAAYAAAAHLPRSLSAPPP